MHQYTLLLSGAILVLAVWSASSEPVNFDLCPVEGANSADFCNVSNMRIEPCPDGPVSCKLKRGETGHLLFDFTPNWTPVGPVKTWAYWASFLDLPFPGMDKDVCKYATCPLAKGQPNNYNFTLQLSKKYKAQNYNIKFKIWDDEEPANEDRIKRHQCCIIFKLELL